VACASARSPIPVPPRFFFVGCSALAPEERVGGVDLDAMSERELDRLHSGLVRLASLDEPVLAALVEQVLASNDLASSS
jgi:hypothetical protein